jgi:hypothetical protein
MGSVKSNPSEASRSQPLPFEQQPNESNKAFAAFSLYLGMGDRRSYPAVAAKLGRSEQLIGRWCSKYRWLERVKAYVEHLAAVEREAAESVARLKAVDWAKRREKLLESEWEMHGKCLDAARKALDAFLAKPNVYVNLADISRMLEVASKLGRLASGMATDKTEVTGEDGGPLRVEFMAALDRVYGATMEAEVVSPAALPEATEGGK